MDRIQKIKSFFTSDITESIGAFFGGGISATIVSYHLMNDVVWPMIFAVLTGLVGGAAALLGKDLYKWIKKKIIK